MKAILTVDNLRFECAHKLNNYVGKCANLHGHSYRMSVSVEGEVDSNGFVVDFGKIRGLCEDTIVSVFDHSYLNDMMDVNPTAENMAILFAQKLRLDLHIRYGVALHSLKLWETENNCIELNF